MKVSVPSVRLTCVLQRWRTSFADGGAYLMRRVLKWTFVVFACGFLLLQFSRPARTNPVADESRSIDARLHVTPEVRAIFARACDDCHTNHTRWPWYSN